MLNNTRMIPFLRTAHLLSVCAWIGGGLGVALLLMLDLRPASAYDLQAFNLVIDEIDTWIIAPGALATLVSGVALAGARHLSIANTPWLKFKLVCTLSAILFGFFFVANWLDRLQVYSPGGGLLPADDRLYHNAYLVGLAGSAIQGMVVLILLAVSVLRPRPRKRERLDCHS